MSWRLVTVLALTVLSGFGGDWNPRLAADYLDARQKLWAAWPRADDGQGRPCLSCHTGLPYLLSRPALRRALGESTPSSYETGLLDGLRHRLAKKTPQEYAPKSKEPFAGQALGVEAILSALVLAAEDSRRGVFSEDTEQAFERMWSLQIPDGKAKGGWNWNSLGVDPWEMPDSAFYGASLAALAVGMTPSAYQSRPKVRANVEALQTYLASLRETQPVHHRLVLVWASTKLPGTLSPADRQKILDDVWRRQQPDGGWTMESLGPWPAHPNAPPAEGSSGYATGLVAFVMQRAGVAIENPGLSRALGWLRSHQDAAGFWEARSMNKRYEPDSMPSQFMRDAATGFASLALLEAR